MSKPNISEDYIQGESVEDYVLRLSELKAEYVANEYQKNDEISDLLIIASDQALECKNKILGKPGNNKNAKEQLNFMNGKVASVLEEEGVVVTANAVFIQGIFGMGGENRGELRVLVDNREDELTPKMISDDVKGAVIVGGSFVSLEAYKKAISVGAAAVVAGGFNYHDLQDVLGYVLGVAITGSENLGTSLILTEGYGRIPMGNRSFELLQQHNGKFTSVNGSTQIRAGVIRPEIVIPLTVEDDKGSKSEKDTASGISAGSMVRVIRAPYFGDIGTVVSLPAELQQMESETMVRVAEVEISGKTLVIPRANLEMVETS